MREYRLVADEDQVLRSFTAPDDAAAVAEARHSASNQRAVATAFSVQAQSTDGWQPILTWVLRPPTFL